MTQVRNHSVGAAPGKVILFGEHAVVHGRPAVAAALSHGLGVVVRPTASHSRLNIPRWGRNGLVVEADPKKEVGNDAVSKAFRRALDLFELHNKTSVDVTIDGELPLGVGLGSSAAFSVSLIRGLADYCGVRLNDENLRRNAHELESIFHGNSSGLDHSVIIQNECLRFHPRKPPQYQPVKIGIGLPIVVAWTPRLGTTKDAVSHVATLAKAQPALSDQIFDTIASVVDRACEALKEGDFTTIGQLMNMNHGLLSALGVVSVENDKMVSIARAAGALGAKVTGAGFGGAVIALAPGAGERVRDRLIASGYPALLNFIQN